MTKEKTLQEKFEDGDLDDQYAEFIMENCHGERVICNGHMLLDAMEEGYLAESFLESLS